MPWCWKRNAKTESTSSSGTKAEIPSESTAATCRTSSQHVLLLSAPVSESCQIPDGKETDYYNLQREQKRYGYRRITKELHNNDICVSHKTVRKLMKQLGLVCQVRAKGSTVLTKAKLEKQLQTCWNGISRQTSRIGNGSQMLPSSK